MTASIVIATGVIVASLIIPGVFQKPTVEKPLLLIDSPISKKSISSKAEDLRENALKNALFVDNYGNRGLVERDDFQINYISSSNGFIIHIWDTKSPEETVQRAENYFLEDILNTDDKDSACELNVVVANPFSAPYPLSFCPRASGSSTPSTSFVDTAVAVHDWCSDYPLNAASDWCSTEKMLPYFGNLADEAARVAYRESHCDPLSFNPTGCGGSGCVGLFNVSREAHCGSKTLSSDRGVCRVELEDPEKNVWVSRQIWEGPKMFCKYETPRDGIGCNPWEAACECHLCGNLGDTGIPVPPQPGLSLPGNIKVEKFGISPGVASQTVSIDSGAFSTTNDTFEFTGLTAGEHTVHLTLVEGDVLLNKAAYTICDSTQPDCGDPADPQKYHFLDKLQRPQFPSTSEAVVPVTIPSGGFVDIHWIYPPFALPKTGAPSGEEPKKEDVSEILTKYKPIMKSLMDTGQCPGGSCDVVGGDFNGLPIDRFNELRPTIEAMSQKAFDEFGYSVRPEFMAAVMWIESSWTLNPGILANPIEFCTGHYPIFTGPDICGNTNVNDEIISELGQQCVFMNISEDPDGLGTDFCGGAMGMAQFIPGTWVGKLPKIKTLTGRTFANPYHERDAIAANAIYLGELLDRCGSEELASGAYYSGGCTPGSDHWIKTSTWLPHVEALFAAACVKPPSEACPVGGCYVLTGEWCPVGPCQCHGTAHEGIDLAQPLGTPVFAVEDGVVISIHDTCDIVSAPGFVDKDCGGGWGNNIVTFGNNSSNYFLYAHLRTPDDGGAIPQWIYDHPSWPFVPVKQGDVIGYIDSTGWSLGHHLHFETSINGTFSGPPSTINPGDLFDCIPTTTADQVKVCGGPQICVP